MDQCPIESASSHTRHGKQNYKCRDCGRQFVLDSQWQILSDHQKELIERLLLERLSLAGIARVLQLSEDCVQRYVNRHLELCSPLQCNLESPDNKGQFSYFL